MILDLTEFHETWACCPIHVTILRRIWYSDSLLNTLVFCPAWSRSVYEWELMDHIIGDHLPRSSCSAGLCIGLICFLHQVDVEAAIHHQLAVLPWMQRSTKYASHSSRCMRAGYTWPCAHPALEACHGLPRQACGWKQWYLHGGCPHPLRSPGTWNHWTQFPLCLQPTRAHLWYSTLVHPCSQDAPSLAQESAPVASRTLLRWWGPLVSDTMPWSGHGHEALAAAPWVRKVK